MALKAAKTIRRIILFVAMGIKKNRANNNEKSCNGRLGSVLLPTELRPRLCLRLPLYFPCGDKSSHSLEKLYLLVVSRKSGNVIPT